MDLMSPAPAAATAATQEPLTDSDSEESNAGSNESAAPFFDWASAHDSDSVDDSDSATDEEVHCDNTELAGMRTADISSFMAQPIAKSMVAHSRLHSSQRATPKPDTLLAFTAQSSLFQIQRQLHRDKHSLFNRLMSINYDSGTVAQIAAQFPAFPCMANLRQGAWYVDPKLSNYGGTCCFKSSDGHNHQWMLNLRRLNLHVALQAARCGGVLIVDSTRGGKKLPDALSKTVPLWACVLNRAIQQIRQRHMPSRPADTTDTNNDCALEDSDHPNDANALLNGDEAVWGSPDAMALHTAPTVAGTETVQIEDRIPQWLRMLDGSEADLKSLAQLLHRPLRPVWVCADDVSQGMSNDSTTNACLGSVHTVTLAQLKGSQLNFTPLVCIMASETVHPKRGEFVYGQGAADDEEGWSHGLTSQLFWSNRDQLLSTRIEDGSCLRIVHQLVQGHADNAPKCNIDVDCQSCAITCPLTKMPVADYTFVRGTKVAIGTETFAKSPDVWHLFGAVINCGTECTPHISTARERPSKTRARAPKVTTGNFVTDEDVVGHQYLCMQIPTGGKNGKRNHMFLRSNLPHALTLSKAVLECGKPILLHCGPTEERAIAVATAIIVCNYSKTEDAESGQLNLQIKTAQQSTPELPLSKSLMRRVLVLVQSARPHAESPPRNLLQELNRYFLSG
eukprot:SAG31_NODE_3554_length_4129_cov_2.346402_3_plen_678_part_00